MEIPRTYDPKPAPPADVFIERDELIRLRAIEVAAKKWRKSLEDDGWAKEAIEDGFCRDGMQDLMKLITV